MSTRNRLTPIVGTGLAAVAAGSLVLFSVVAQTSFLGSTRRQAPLRASSPGGNGGVITLPGPVTPPVSSNADPGLFELPTPDEDELLAGAAARGPTQVGAGGSGQETSGGARVLSSTLVRGSPNRILVTSAELEAALKWNRDEPDAEPAEPGPPGKAHGYHRDKPAKRGGSPSGSKKPHFVHVAGVAADKPKKAPKLAEGDANGPPVGVTERAKSEIKPVGITERAKSEIKRVGIAKKADKAKKPKRVK